MHDQVHGLGAYLERLKELPFVKAARFAAVSREDGVEAELRTKTQKYRLRCEIRKSHLSTQAVDYLVATLKGTDTLILAPAVGRDIGDRLEAAGMCFVDLAGNCFVHLGDNYVARIQGRTAEKRPSVQKGLRAPAYRALFVLLAEPTLVDAPVRQLADAAGVSRQAATDIRHRLAEMGILYRDGERFGWVPKRAEQALEMFAIGYLTTLRQQLVVGRYRGPDKDPLAMEKRLKKALPKSAFRWGGGAAAHRMLAGYYHGPNTVMHLDEPTADLPRRLGVVPDNNGPLHVLTFPGPLGHTGPKLDVAHPLLVYAELRAEGGERAAETAREVAGKWLTYS